MTPMEPGNVPEPTTVQWEIARRDKATMRQMHALQELATFEGVDLAGLYGDGYVDETQLSKWAAHWGITVLESRRDARATDEAMRAIEERREKHMKAWIGEFYRRKHPGKYPYTPDPTF
jgi:hypothetical protein